MKALRNQKGFTLVELAIVLVIIGIIVGAVLKGQDLIENAKHKKFINKVKAWEVAQWTFYDRNGRFAGDNQRNGIIGDQTDENVKWDFTHANFIYPPYEGTSGSETNTITLGSTSFYVYFGNDGTKNVMIICGNSTCGSLNDTQREYLKALDASIDGTADGTNGQIIGVSSGIGTPSTSTWIATISIPTIVDWNASTPPVALVYYFDSKR